MPWKGYFVHFFSPSNIRQAPKHVVFVIDVSASMYGIKLRQVKDSLKIILDDLAPNDRFNIITFSDDVTFWKQNRLVPATFNNIREAKAFVESLTDLDGKKLYCILYLCKNRIFWGTCNIQWNHGKKIFVVVGISWTDIASSMSFKWGPQAACGSYGKPF